MTTVCNIWMICLELNWFVYDPSWMLHLSELVWALRFSVLVVINNFLFIDATDRSNISSNQKPLFFAASLYPLSFFANTPFKTKEKEQKCIITLNLSSGSNSWPPLNQVNVGSSPGFRVFSFPLRSANTSLASRLTI